MTTYNGNKVAYSGSYDWYVQLVVTNGSTNSSGQCEVTFTYKVVFETSVSDSTNTASGTDIWGSHTWNNRSYSEGTGGGSYTLFSDTRTAGGIGYSGKSINFTLKADNIASGDTGPSSLNINHPLPGKPKKAPSTPYGYYAGSITASDAYQYGAICDDNGGDALNNLRIQWGKTQSTSNPTRTMGSWTNGYMDNLEAGTLYWFRIQIANDYGWSNYGGWVSFTSSSTVPAAPTMGNISNITDDTADIYWTAGDNNGATVSGYQVQVSTTSNFSNIIKDASVPGAPYLATGLTPFTQYWTRARTNSNMGVSAWAVAKSFSTSPGSPGPPGNPTYSNIQAAQAIVNWTAAQNNGIAITSYQVQLALDQNFTQGVKTVQTANGVTLTALVTGLRPISTYYGRVRARTAQGDGPWSLVVTNFTTLPGLWLNVDGVNKPSVLWLTVGTTPKQSRLWTNVGGVWK